MNHKEGFSQLAVILIAVAIVVIGGGLYFALKAPQPNTLKGNTVTGITVVQPSITFIDPKGGEVLTPGQQVKISFSITGDIGSKNYGYFIFLKKTPDQILGNEDNYCANLENLPDRSEWASCINNDIIGGYPRFPYLNLVDGKPALSSPFAVTIPTAKIWSGTSYLEIDVANEPEIDHVIASSTSNGFIINAPSVQ